MDEINQKIFVIGFNKTGTTSLHQLFTNIGLRSVHGVGNYVMSEINNYDCFTDGDHFDFEEYYREYPNSLFNNLSGSLS